MQPSFRQPTTKRHVDGDLRKTEHKSYDNRIDEHFIAKYDWTNNPGMAVEPATARLKGLASYATPWRSRYCVATTIVLMASSSKRSVIFGRPEQANTYLGIQQDRIAPIPQHKVGEAPTRARNNLLVTLERLRKTRGM
jgi:hypothetical protein